MLENESMAIQVSKETKNIQGIRTVPDPEVREKAVRRKFTAEHKLRILKEALVRNMAKLAPCYVEKGFIHPISLHGDSSLKKGH